MVCWNRIGMPGTEVGLVLELPHNSQDFLLAAGWGGHLDVDGKAA
jgi:hypothetical protein